jgi:hypothetical protein
VTDPRDPRQNWVIGASGVLDLPQGASGDAILDVMGKVAELIAILPADQATPTAMSEMHRVSVAHLLSIGAMDADELVHAALMKGFELRARDDERTAQVAQREKELQEKEAHRGVARSQMLIALAATMRRGGFNETTIYAALVAENRRCDPPLVPDELSAIAKQVCRFAPQDVPWTRKVAAEIKKAIKGPGPSEDESLPNFRVEKVLIVDSDPPHYWLTIDGEAYLWTAEELSSATRFKLRYLKTVRRMPQRLPTTPAAWDEMVDAWLSRATTVAQPPDASPAILIREHIQHGIVGLPQGSVPLDLDDGSAVMHSGRITFKSIAAVKIARELDGHIGSHYVCDHLRILGYVYRSLNYKLDDGSYKSVKVWVGPDPEPTPPTPETPETPETPGNGHDPEPLHGGNGHGLPQAVQEAPPPTDDDLPFPTPTDIDDDSEDIPF